jgi:hypothetical protein
LLGGLWEFPGAIVPRGESVEDAAARAARAQPARLNGGDSVHLGSIPHTFTHRREIYHAYRFSAEPARNGEPGEHIWVDAVSIAGYDLPVAQRKIARLVFDD